MMHFMDVLIFCVLTISLKAQCNNSSRITVTGWGVAQGIPDIAVIFIQISNTSISATNASLSVHNSLQQALSIINSHKIPLTQVQTLNINLVQVTNNNGNITGYNSSQILKVQIFGIGDAEGVPLGIFIDQISFIVGTTISGVRFEAGNKTSLLNTARANSFQNVRYYASLFSSLGGFKLQSLSNVVEIQQTSSYNATIKFNINDLMGFKQSIPSIYSVKITTTVQYTLVY